MDGRLKKLTDFLIDLGIEKVDHSQKTYLGHLIAVQRLMQSEGCDEELCKAGMFHSIYGTQQFQGFKLPVESRPQVRELIGERAEWLAYLNCAMNRETFDAAAQQTEGPYRFVDRLTGETVELTATDFDDLCRVHLYDWLEQVARSRYGWDYRRAAYHQLADRLGGAPKQAYERVFAAEKLSQ